jgi:lipopolysaccharide/colanic/teichoic acid biosynthesis glycosyltransferase
MSRDIKLIVDYLLALILLVLIMPILIILIIIATVSTGKFGVFSQQRVGKQSKLFNIYKIRSMIVQKGDVITAENDPRITKFGHFIRKTKLDELPQLFNIIKGDMSFVGPRPDVLGYADKLQGDDRIILSVKPGITGPATIFYKDEEHLLAQQKNKIQYNDNVIWPNKVRINREYLENWSLLKDLIILKKTIF